MLIILGLILMIVIVLVGGDRGRHVSDRSGGKYFVPESCNLALCRRSTRVSGYCRCRNFNFLYHFVLSKWDEY